MARDLDRPQSSGTRTKVTLTMESVAKLEAQQSELRRDVTQAQIKLAQLEGQDKMHTQTLQDLKAGQAEQGKTLDGMSGTLGEIKAYISASRAVEEERRRHDPASHPGLPIAPAAPPQTQHAPPPGLQTRGAWESMSPRAKTGTLIGGAAGGGALIPYIIEGIAKLFGG